MEGFGNRSPGRKGFKKSGKRSSGGFGGKKTGGFKGKTGRLPMVDAVCDDCGKKCAVPFKPSGDKPVYCSDCFEKKGGSSKSGKSNSFVNDFKIINEKLDKIMKELDIE